MRWIKRRGEAPPPELDRSIPFFAYAEDHVISGRLALESERLTDLLTSSEVWKVVDVTLDSLIDDTTFELASADVRRDDLLIVAGTGPRGNPSRRLRTRAYPVYARVGPYEILGDVHAIPPADPIAVAQRRPIIPITGGIVRYDRGGLMVEREHDTMLLNRDRLEALELVADPQAALADARARPRTALGI